MFEEYFGLRIRPFSKTPDPKFLFYSKSHEEALARLMQGVEEKELILLTGEVGAGKTTLSRALMDSLGDEYRVISILNPRLTPIQFLKSVAKGFNIDITRAKDELLDSIYEKVYEDYTKGITPVIIIDEAQLIPYKSTFEEIRLLTNFQLDDENLLSVILIGQPDLRNRLERKAYLPLRQRIGFRYHLNPLNDDEVKEYVKHRLSVAGRTDLLFSEDAIEALCRLSQGIPRNINNLASNSLLECFGTEAQTVSKEIVCDVGHELGLNGVK
ncbi:MAG TPA: AAA family ATPase [Nitrospirae bacterium]|nr:AAA family ATPase [Nitrospirota bacterium]